MATLKERYNKDIVPKMLELMKAKNRLGVPRLMKVVVNMGFGIVDEDGVKNFTEQLAKITGQKPITIKSRKSISNFKLRKGMIIGAKVTLRSDRMYEYLDRLINAGLPRIRDFRGLSPNSFDGRGNYTFGIQDQTIFPEIDPNNATVTQGMDITIVTNARNNNDAYELLKLLGVPFSKKQ